MKQGQGSKRAILEKMPAAIACHRPLTDSSGKTLDYNFIDINREFKKMTGLASNRVVGKNITEVLPEINKLNFDWIGVYGKVAVSGKSICFEQFFELLGRWYEITAFRDETGIFNTVFRDVTEIKNAEEALRAKDNQGHIKTPGILSPDEEMDSLSLADIIDMETVQSLLDEFFKLTHMGVAIISANGDIVASTGRQDICSKFHRSHPEAAKYCAVSNPSLLPDFEPGKFILFRCKHNIWQMATPLVMAEKNMGNVVMKPFFFDDEEIDYKFFRLQVKKYGFDEGEYLKALESIPRLDRDMLNQVMRVYVKIADLISQLSYSNYKLGKLLAARDFTQKHTFL